MPRRSAIRLTKRSVDALLCENKDTVFWDRDLAGFGVRVLPSGRKVFVVQSRGPRGSKYRGVLNNHVVPALGDRAVEAVERSDVIGLH